MILNPFRADVRRRILSNQDLQDSESLITKHDKFETKCFSIIPLDGLCGGFCGEPFVFCLIAIRYR
jgi:hypothetical protein